MKAVAVDEVAATIAAVAAEVIDVDVRLAKEWLETHETWVVRTHDQKVEQYVQAMSNGRWRHFSGDHITFRDGTLVDGWARLTAVVASGVTCSFLVAGRIPEPRPPEGTVMLRNKAGRIVCQFCRGDYGRGLERRDIVLHRDGEDIVVPFVVCRPCLKLYRVPSSQEDWFDDPGAKRDLRIKTAEENAEKERGIPRFQPMGEVRDCTRCSGQMRIFETINNKKYALDVNQLRSEEVAVDHRWVFVPSTRRVAWNPYLREGVLVFFPHFVVCGATKKPPEKMVARTIWAHNGGERPVDTDFDDALFDPPWDPTRRDKRRDTGGTAEPMF